MSGTSDVQATSDPPLETFDAPWGRVTYSNEGPRTAPALIAIHGIPGSFRDFRYLAPLLSDCIRFVRIELPGFGGSAPSEDAIVSFAGRVRAILALADQLRLSRFAVLGHSMGGGPALVTAARHPERISHLFLVASVALSRHRGLGMPAWGFRLLGRALATPLVRRLFLDSARAAYRRRRFASADAMGPAEFATHFRAIGAVDFRALRRAVAGPLPPTTIAFTRDDPMVEPARSNELVRALPHAEILAFDTGGHNLQKTRASELAAAIRSALTG